jgi:ABC-type multidrug transport system fused ATPase/permease subunit
MQKWAAAQVKSQISLSLLNIGQAAIIAVAVTLIMWRAATGVANGSMTVGDIVLVNGLLIQLYIPLNWLGVLYREIRQALTDIERMFALKAEHREIADAPMPRRWPPAPAPCASSTSAFPTRRSGRSSSTSISPFPPAARWRWSAIPARASRRCRACCSASTTCRAAR